MSRNRQRGQSMVEYAIVSAALIYALFVFDGVYGMTAAEYLIKMLKAFFRSLTYFISLP